MGNTFENSENNRFRFNTDAFSVVLLGLFVDRVVIRRWRGAKRTLPAQPAGDRTTPAIVGEDNPAEPRGHEKPPG